VVAGSDWIIDIGPGAGDEGGRVVASGPPAELARSRESRTAPYLARFLGVETADESRRRARTRSPERGAMAAAGR
jgi:excinuclease UvrABC ATPase subunit